MSGQRVFNSDEGASSSNTPADALYRLAKRYEAADTPTLGEVRTLAGDLTADSIERIYSQTEQRLRAISGTSAATRVTAWSMIQNGIRQARDAERFRR